MSTTTLVGDEAKVGGRTIKSSASASGTPNSVVDGNAGDVWINSHASYIGEMWLKTSGSTGNTGWVRTVYTPFPYNLGHPDYVSQTTGWQISDEGAADFRYLFTDELHAKAFIADLEQALAGGQIIAKSVALVGAAFTVPAAGAAATLTVKDLPSAADMAVFESGDTIRIRSFSRAAGTLSISDCWGVVTTYADQAGGLQTWTFTRNTGANAGAMAAATVIAVESVVLDYGVSGNGIYEVNAADGLYGVNSPYAQIVTWAGDSPIAANLTVRARLGNLKGITSADEYGLIAGTYAATGGQYFRASDVAFELHGIDLSLWDGSTKTFLLDHTAPSLALGNPLPSAYGTGAGLWAGKDGSVYKFRVGDPAGGQLAWDGTALKAAGWTISANSLTDTAGVVGLSSAVTGGNDIRIWAGDATPANADFRVYEDGSVVAANITATGTINATAGYFGSGSTRVAIEDGGLSVGNAGSIRGGASAFGTDIGFWIGYDTSAYKFRVGDPSGQRAIWDGTNFEVYGANWSMTAAGGWALDDCSDESDTANLIHLGTYGGLIGGNSDRTVAYGPGNGSNNYYINLKASEANIGGAGAGDMLRIEDASIGFFRDALPDGDKWLGSSSNPWNDIFTNHITVYDDGGSPAVSIYADGVISGGTLVDRTPWPTDDGPTVLAALLAVKGDGKGQIDHASLPSFAREMVRRQVPVNGRGQRVSLKTYTGRPQMREETAPGRSLSAMVSLLTIAVQQQQAQIDALMTRV